MPTKVAGENPERVREISRASKNRYKDRDAIKNREHVSEWKKKYPERARAQNARRKAYKLCATPAWADQEAIDAIYADAVRVGLTVDHIVPLKSPIVCGLHVPWNLRLLSEAENNKKGNRWVW